MVIEYKTQAKILNISCEDAKIIALPSTISNDVRYKNINRNFPYVTIQMDSFKRG